VKDWQSRQKKKESGLISFYFEVEEIQNIVLEKTDTKEKKDEDKAEGEGEWKGGVEE